MSRKLVIIVTLSMLLSGLLCSKLDHAEVKALNGHPIHNLNTGLNYTSIQEAIDANETLDGHLILVEEGSYTENVNVYKSLAIISGGQAERTIVQAADSHFPVFKVTAGYVNITGLTASGSFSYIGSGGLGTNAVFYNIGGIQLDSCEYCNISNNICSGNSFGVLLEASTSNILHGNICYNNSAGIGLYYYSHNNTVTENNCTTNGDGIDIESSQGNLIERNLFSKSRYDGISLYSGNGGEINLAKKNIIIRNEITGNNVAISLYASSLNVVTENNVSDNNHMFYLGYVDGDMVYLNNFINNTDKISAGYEPHGGVKLDNDYPNGGNYYSDYIGNDVECGAHQNQTGADGIGDTQYFIDANNIDHYPLMGIFSNYNVTYFTQPLVSHTCNVAVISDSTISGFVAPIWIEHPEVIFLMFNASGAEGSTGFCRVTFPTAMMNGTYHVSVNGTEIPCTLLSCSDANYSYLYFTYTHSTETVIIIPEFPSFLILPLFIVTTLLAVTVYKKKEKLSRAIFAS